MIAHDIPSAVTAPECEFLASMAAGQLVLEMGAHFGRSTVALASSALRVHSVDWHRGDAHAGHNDTLSIFLENLDRHGVRDRVVVHLGRFEHVLPVLRANAFGLIFLDGFHLEEQVIADYLLARRCLRPGGRFAFHDYGSSTFGVTEAVDSLGLPIRRVGNVAMVTP